MNTKQNILPKIKYDGQVTIAVGRSRQETEWKNREILWSKLLEKLAVTTRTRESLAEYDKLSKLQQGAVKDVGGFVGGTLKGGRRNSTTIGWRRLLTLDADFADADFALTTELMLGDCAYAIYSTHKHRPEKPRLRLVVPLDRAVTPDEYQAISRRIAADIGIDLFDDTTYQPHRLMYWPSTAADADFVFLHNDGAWLAADEVLARYDDWRDQSCWPVSSRTHQARKKLAEKQGDPLEKPGVIGAFCRSFSIEGAIAEFLPDVYTACAMPGRYTYSEGTSTAGLVIYEDKFAYSHHGTDPISELLVNAFDLVRLHKFGSEDADAKPGTPVGKMPSYKRMMEFASQLPAVKRTLGEERLANASLDFDAVTDENWLEQMQVNRRGAVESTPNNVILILQHDPNLAGRIAMDDFARRIVVRGDLPWRRLERGKFWSDQDDSGLRNYLSKTYDVSGIRVIDDALNEVLLRNAFHPIREYLDGLEWDGIPRMDTLLIDYLGADDTPYVRAVTRKAILAAVARVRVPGIKFDNVLVLVGPQGVGKSYLFKRLGKKWFSDSLTTVQGKDAMEQIQGSWLIELAELSAARRSDAEAVKHFISKQEDAFRVAYGRQTSYFPRQCIFIGTTNESTFLKDKTGNRRFWPVEVGGGERRLSLWDDMDDEEINQIWAEAADAWQGGESLYIGTALEREVQTVHERFIEESPMAGVVREYLERKLPEDWESMDLSERRAWLHGGDFDSGQEGKVQRQRVCTMEVWAELLEGSMKQLTKSQSMEINDILRNTPGWEAHKGDGKLSFGTIYGRQRAFVRTAF